jgi:hypothetical protein
MKSLRPPNPKTKVPPAIRVQLSRLFGSQSIETKKDTFTDTEWKHHLHRILKELERYLRRNIDTDELHMYMICTGFLAAEEALKQEDFWPAYTEAILRITFLLLGDYPDHRRRKGGRKREEHYHLQRFRSVRYIQDTNQKLKTLLAVPRFGLPNLGKDPNDALHEFRGEFGFKKTYKDFFKWYKEKYGKDYALVF